MNNLLIVYDNMQSLLAVDIKNGVAAANAATPL
jgi:hypothetical protein